MERKHPLRIAIVGAGLGGSAAAVCFARLGHQVTVFEQRETLNPAGGGISIRPSAARCLLSWGLGPNFDAKADVSPATVLRDLKTGKIATRNVAIDTSDYPDWGTTREETLRILYDKAVAAGANMRFGVDVQDVREDAERVTLVLRTGETVATDLLLAADGIRSRLRPKILSGIRTTFEPCVSSITLYSTRVDGDSLKQDPVTKSMCETSDLTVWMGAGKFVVGRWNHKLDAYGYLFGIQEATDQKGLWDEDGDIEHVRKAFSASCPALRTALTLSSKCDRWKLAEMPDLERWTSKGGRMLLLGDSAHGMLPNAAQGFSQIIEDIAALEYLLQKRPQLSISEATHFWQQFRKPRVDRIKEFAAWNTKVFLDVDNYYLAAAKNQKGSGNIKSMKGIPGDRDAPLWTGKFLKWTQDYDVVGEVKRFLERPVAKI